MTRTTIVMERPTADELALLRGKLPRGSRKIIATRTGKSIDTVYHTLHGFMFNVDIIQAANDIIREARMNKEQALNLGDN